jgi:hypothetical protein
VDRNDNGPPVDNGSVDDDDATYVRDDDEEDDEDAAMLVVDKVTQRGGRVPIDASLY